MDKKENIVHNVSWLSKAVHTFSKFNSPTNVFQTIFKKSNEDEFQCVKSDNYQSKNPVN